MEPSTAVERPRRARAQGKPSGRLCGARTRSGGRCKKGAGWGTDHLGTGSCKLHGGSTRSGRVAAAKQALDDYMAANAPDVEVDPIDALLYAVRRSSMRAGWLRLALADETDAVKRSTWAAQEGEALGELARFSKMALDAGVAERRVRLAERTGALIAQALEDALAELQLPARQRAKLARAFQARLLVLETADDLDGEEAG